MHPHLKEKFLSLFGRPAQYLFETPGRTELGGNHTDHQLGCVLAGAIDLCITAAVAENHRQMISVYSDGFGLCQVNLFDLSPLPEEAGTTASLIRGIAAGFAKKGHQVPGFDAYLVSDVLPGNGLSSSAAFEVLMGSIINHLSHAFLHENAIAKIGQFAENTFFGKPCGLMDQMACATGGIIAIDFSDPTNPLVEPICFDFSGCGYTLCIIESGASHEGLTDAYAAIPKEMGQIAAFFEKKYLRHVSEDIFYDNLGALRRQFGDRAVLRAIHFFDENRRVVQQKEALKHNDLNVFFHLVNQSGDSSWKLLQNIHLPESSFHQEVALALALTKALLRGQGACRVHGGGFAGTIQAYVPNHMLECFRKKMESVLGSGSCHCLSIRQKGATYLEIAE